MTKKSKRDDASKGGPSEQDALLKSLRTHKQVIESEDENVSLPAGVTHVYVKPAGKEPGVLVEKRKSFFKR